MTKFNKERCEQILESIRAGVPNKYAARASGISEKQLHVWLNKGLLALENELDTDYAQFFINYSKIHHDRIKKYLAEISSMPERWQAIAWILERRWWKEFSPNGQIRDLAKKIESMELEGVIDVKIECSTQKEDSKE